MKPYHLGYVFLTMLMIIGYFQYYDLQVENKKLKTTKIIQFEEIEFRGSLIREQAKKIKALEAKCGL